MATRGSLDNPPLVITTSPGRMVWMCAVSVLFVAFSVYEIGWGHVVKDVWKFYVAIGLFGLGIPVFIWRLVSPARLELSPNGLVWFNGRKAIDYSWSDFAEFRAYRPSPRMRSFFIGFDWAPHSAKRSSLSGVTRSVAGVDGSFGGSWSVDAETLAGLLNQATRRWSQRSAVAPTATRTTFGHR